MNRIVITRGGLAFAVAAISGALVLHITRFHQDVEPALAGARDNSMASAARTSQAPPTSVVREFTTFALNALLLPLLDDDVPARWADPSISMDCYGARVTIDGDRLDVGAPVPSTFMLRWRMDGCTPMGTGIELSGDVALMVQTEASGYRASVRPMGFRITTAHGTEAMTETFTAFLASDVPLRPRLR